MVVGRRWGCPQIAKTAAIDGLNVLQTSHRFGQRLATYNQLSVRSSDHILEACGAATASCRGSNIRGRRSCLVVLAPLRLLLSTKVPSGRPLMIIPACRGSLLSPRPLLVLPTADGCRCLREYDSGPLTWLRRPGCRLLGRGPRCAGGSLDGSLGTAAAKLSIRQIDAT